MYDGMSQPSTLSLLKVQSNEKYIQEVQANIMQFCIRNTGIPNTTNKLASLKSKAGAQRLDKSKYPPIQH